MPLIKESSIKAFDTAAIHKGDLVHAQYHTWPEPRNGVKPRLPKKSWTSSIFQVCGTSQTIFPSRPPRSRMESGAFSGRLT